MTPKLSADMQKVCAARGFIYVWQMPIRFTHWVNAISIAVLVFTGIYIHYPFVTYNYWLTEPYVMGQIRFIHYLTGIIFTFSVLLRLVYVIIGNEYSNWRSFFNPFNKEDRAVIINYLKYYAFLERHAKHVITHNPMAQYSYIALFILFLYQIFSGFFLWSLHDPSGTLFSLFGWMGSIASIQYIRFLHYFVVFIIGAFLVVHLYAGTLMDFRTRSGDMSSIFSGWKTDVCEDHDDDESGHK